jgi:hypothetical protein
MQINTDRVRKRFPAGAALTQHFEEERRFGLAAALHYRRNNQKRKEMSKLSRMQVTIGK